MIVLLSIDNSFQHEDFNEAVVHTLSRRWRRGKGMTVRPVPAVKRGIDILFHMARAGEPHGVSRIARDLGILPSSCLHILRELVAGGLVRFDTQRKTYTLGPGILTLARAVSGRDVMVELAQGHIERIAQRYGVKATASVYDGQGHIVVVASSEDDEDVHIHIPVGRRVPMLSSATGRLLAAYGQWGTAELRDSFAKVRWQEPLDFRTWQAEVAAVRAQGMAIDDGRYRKGITIIATPVFNADGTTDKFIGALAVTGQLNAKSRRELAQALKDAAAEISRGLGYEK
jgi:DNA-binding IclR family transcriptional regulator